MSKRRVSRSWSLLPMRSLVGGAGMHLTDRSAALKQVFPSLAALCCLSQRPVHLCQRVNGPSRSLSQGPPFRDPEGRERGLGSCLREATALGGDGVSSEASRGSAMASAPLPHPPAASRGTGEPAQVKEQEAVSPAGRPLGSRHLHLAAVPHASLGMEVMEEIPEGETFHFQARLEDPE